jgi:hypothetical protein
VSDDKVDRGDKDKVQVGLGQEADAALKDLVANGVFPSESVGYRFGVAYALSRSIDPSAVEIVANKTKFASTGLDPDARLQTLVRAFMPDCERPYWAAEKLADWGIRDLARRLGAQEGLADILDDAVAAPLGTPAPAPG